MATQTHVSAIIGKEKEKAPSACSVRVGPVVPVIVAWFLSLSFSLRLSKEGATEESVDKQRRHSATPSTQSTTKAS